jgi:hypothetical protein
MCTMVAVFALLQPGWPWIAAGTFCLGLLIGLSWGRRTRQPRLTPAVRPEPPPVRFVRAIGFQGDLFAPEPRSPTARITRIEDAPPLVALGTERAEKSAGREY